MHSQHFVKLFGETLLFGYKSSTRGWFMSQKQCAVALLSGCLLLCSCAHFSKPVPMEQQIAACEAEIRTATIEEKTLPILLGIHPGTRLPSLLHNLAPETAEGLVYWEWAEVSGEGLRKIVKTAYGKLRPEGMEFPFSKELEPSMIYTGIGIQLTFLYKKSTGEWLQRVMVPGILSRKTARQTQEKFNLRRSGALIYADESTRIIDMELIAAPQRAAYIAHAFEMIVIP